jgi:hypothetical protein
MAQDATRGARFWGRRALSGLGLGAVVALLEFAHYAPLLAGHPGFGVGSLGRLLAEWGLEFLILSLAVGIAEALARPSEPSSPRLACALLLGALAGVLLGYAVLDLVLRDLLRVGLFVDHIGQPVEWAGRGLYRGWMLLCFGGLAVAVEASQRRRLRALRELRAAEIARATSQQRLAEISLGTLQARVDPEFVFRTLSKLERLYEVDPPAAERLLDELIVFLREALADLRPEGASRAPA